MTRLLFLLLLLPLAACDSASGSGTYDLALYDDAGDRVARLTFDRPVGKPCDAIGCGSGESEWRATDVSLGLLMGQARGTLYAQETGFGAYRVDLLSDVADGGVSLEIAEDSRGDVQGRWLYGTIVGEMEGGAVRGTVD